MGKNADKRKLRKQQEEPAEGSQPSSPAPAAPSTATAAAPSEAPAWWAAAMLPPAPEAPSDDDDGSLARALFHITALVGSAMARPASLGVQAMQRVAEAVARVVDADTVSLLRLQPGDDMVPARLVLTASHGLASVDTGLVTFAVGDGIAGRVAMTGEALRIDDAPRDQRFARLVGQRTEIGSLVSVPLVVDKKMLGVLTASRREIRAFSPRDEDRLRLVATTIAQDLEQARMYRAAVADPLTGLVSRVALLHAFPREVEISRRYQTQLSMLLLDADGLSTLNETHGRAAGDRFLREVAARLSKAVRAADLVARFGGDEIAVLLPMTPANQARATAKRLLKLLTQPPITPATTFTVAVATLQSHVDEDALSMLARVDAALTEGKAQGGNTIVSAAVERKAVVPAASAAGEQG